MNQNKLTSLLGSLNQQELQRFSKFLQSPFFNENSDLIKLFDILWREAQKKERFYLPEKQWIWGKMFGKKAYQDATFRRLNSELTKMALEFLAINRFRENALGPSIYMLRATKVPLLKKHFEGILRQINQIRQESSLHSPLYYWQNTQISLLRHQQQEEDPQTPTHFDYLENADFQIDCLYICQKLKNYCDTLGYRKSLAIQTEGKLPEGFLENLVGSNYLQEPLIKAYFLVAHTMLHPEEESYFQELKELIEVRGAAIAKHELRAVFIHLLNYCIVTKINAGITRYFQEIFSLYKTALQQAIIFEKGVLNPNHYKNIITVGLQVQAYDWVEEFTKTYTPKLPAEHQKNALNFNLANIYFEKKDYQQVIQQLREVEYENLSYALGSKIILLKTYYELNEMLALDSLIDSFRIYLHRNKRISRELKQQYLNHLRFVKKLSSIGPYDADNIKKVRKQVDQCKILAGRKWILEKLEELE